MGECFFWYRPTRVVPDKRPLSGCVCVCVSIVLRAADNAAKRAAAAATVVNADVMTVTAWYASRACKLIISHSFTHSLAPKNDVQLVTQFPQSRRQIHDVLSAAESVPPISDSEVTCGPMTRPATLSSSATSSSNSTDFSSSSSIHQY